MTIIVNSSAQPAQIRIEGEFTIYTAAESKQQLMDALNEHAAVNVELDAVEEIDTSGVQLLLLVQREAQRLGKTLTLTGASPAVQEVINLLNLAELNAAIDATGEPA
ncbi:MAG: STAS domain-containing protein [Spongiibacteraceae bacterium]